jgi:hypothetical protein
MGNGEGGDGQEKLALSPHQHHQRRHEQQMVYPQQDMFDAEPGVAGDHLPWSRGWQRPRTRLGRIQPLELFGAVCAGKPDEDIGAGEREALEGDRLAFQPARHLDLPAQHGGAIGIGAAARGQLLGSGRKGGFSFSTVCSSSAGTFQSTS